MRPSHFQIALCAFFALPALVFGVSLSTTTHTCYKSLPKTCQTTAVVQPDCDGVIQDVCTQGKTANAGSILYNTSESCTGAMYLGETGNFDFNTCRDAFQGITKDCMLSGGANYASGSQGGVQNMAPYADNFENWDQADTNKPGWIIAALGCVS